jgi:hypothetical protein
VSQEPDRAALEAAAERLQAVARRLADEDAGAEDLRRLAEEALALSAEINERLPRVIRAAEAAAEGRGPG